MNREYSRYLKSDNWKRRRELLIVAHGSRCGLCGIPRVLANLYDGNDLNVHHRREAYARLGEEKPEDVEVRCQLCHGREHDLCGARAYHTEDEWCLLAWLVLMFQQKARPFSLNAPEGLGDSYLNITRKREATVNEIDIAFARMWRKSRGQFPQLTDFATELDSIQVERSV